MTSEFTVSCSIQLSQLGEAIESPCPPSAWLLIPDAFALIPSAFAQPLPRNVADQSSNERVDTERNETEYPITLGICSFRVISWMLPSQRCVVSKIQIIHGSFAANATKCHCSFAERWTVNIGRLARNDQRLQILFPNDAVTMAAPMQQ